MICRRFDDKNSLMRMKLLKKKCDFLTLAETGQKNCPHSRIEAFKEGGSANGGHGGPLEPIGTTVRAFPDKGFTAVAAASELKGLGQGSSAEDFCEAGLNVSKGSQIHVDRRSRW